MTETTALRGTRAEWRIEDPLPEPLREQLAGMSVMVAHLLYCRGYRSVDEIDRFLAGYTDSHDPFLIPDMEPAVERIARAMHHGERIAIYGDFDCDGITSAAALAETFRSLGFDPIVLIPERADGHGLQPEGLAELADRGVELIVTADCGVTAIEEVRVARGMGMDVIVTDHHEARADGRLPDCLTLAPTRHDSAYPFRGLCGAGVAYKLAQGLARSLGAPEPEGILDLVAMGTVADVVPLQDENRSLVIQGLNRLRETRRPGLLALFEAVGVERDRIDPVSISYYLAPRINAANRMATPQLAYDLITAVDTDAAAELAGQLNAYNQQRQLLVADRFQVIADEIGPTEDVIAQVRLGNRSPLLVVIGEWPSGISGLLASKLVDAYGLPAFVGSKGADGVVAMSGRSIPGVHLDELMEQCESSLPGGLFLSYGGHSRAGGFRVDGDRLDQARSMLHEEARARIIVDEVGSSITIDAEVSLGQLTLSAAEKIVALAPFGIGFPEPLFLARNVAVHRLRPTRDGKHVRLTAQAGGYLIDGIAFSAPELKELAPGSHLDLVFHLQVNEWQGRRKPEITVRDWRMATA